MDLKRNNNTPHYPYKQGILRDLEKRILNVKQFVTLEDI